MRASMRALEWRFIRTPAGHLWVVVEGSSDVTVTSIFTGSSWATDVPLRAASAPPTVRYELYEAEDAGFSKRSAGFGQREQWGAAR